MNLTFLLPLTIIAPVCGWPIQNGIAAGSHRVYADRGGIATVGESAAGGTGQRPERHQPDGRRDNRY